MGSILKPRMPALPPVQPLPEPPSAEISDEEREAIAKEQAALERRRKGRKSTILTSNLTPEAEAEIKKKSLLGE